MRVDATVVLEIKDSKDFVEVEIPDAQPDSVVGVQVNAYISGCWTGGTPGVGTHYPGSRIYSVHATYRDHCGNEECTKPYGKERGTYANAYETLAHTHTLPKPKPEPKDKGEGEGKGKGKGKGKGGKETGGSESIKSPDIS